MKSAEMAAFLGFSQPVYSRYENGRTPDVDTVAAIAGKLSVTVDWLLGRGDDTAPRGPGPPPVAEAPPCQGCVAKDAEISYLKSVVSDQAQSLRDQAATIRALSSGVCRYPTADTTPSTPSSKAG